MIKNSVSKIVNKSKYFIPGFAQRFDFMIAFTIFTLFIKITVMKKINYNIE